MKKILVLFFSVMCLIDNYAWSTGFTSNLRITGLDVGDTNSLFIRFDANTECGNTLARVSNTQQYYKDMLALASTAYVTQTTVRAWVSECDQYGTATIVRLVVGTVW